MAEARVAGEVRVGISGWRYPPWRGVFYPEGLAQRRELEYAVAPDDLGRDQRLVLLAAAAGVVPAVGGGDPGRLRLRGQGPRASSPT